MGTFFDFLSGSISSKIQEIIGWVLTYLNQTPDVSNASLWPAIAAAHDGFSWLGGFFVVALTFQGVKYVMAADSPGGRANAKSGVQKLVVGMAFISVNGLLFGLGLDVSRGLGDAFMWKTAQSVSNFDVLLLAAMGTLTCFLLPVASLVIGGFLLMVLARYIMILVLYAFFPLILAFYFTNFSFLHRLGARGLNLYIAAVLSYPVMAFMFGMGLDMVNIAVGTSNPAAYGAGAFNPLDKIVTLTMGIVVLGLGAISPVMVLGLAEKAGSMLQLGGVAAGVIVGAVATPATGAAVAGITMAGGQAVSGLGGGFNALGGGSSMTASMRQGLVHAASTGSKGFTEYQKGKAAEEKEMKFGPPKDIHSPLVSRSASAKVPNTGGRSVQSIVEQRMAQVAAKGHHDIFSTAGFKSFVSECAQDPGFSNALRVYNQQSGNYTDLDDRGKPTEKSRVVDWTRFEGRWNTEGREFLMQTAAGGGLVELSEEGNVNVTEKGRTMLQRHGVEVSELEARKTPYGKSMESQEQVRWASEDGIIQDGQVLFKSPGVYNAEGYSYTVSEKAGRYHVMAEGNNQGTYTSFNPADIGVASQQEAAAKIIQVSHESGLKPEEVAHYMHDWRPAGVTHHGYTWHQDKGDYYENMVVDSSDVKNTYKWRTEKGSKV
jgi:hypothetical protein